MTTLRFSLRAFVPILAAGALAGCGGDEPWNVLLVTFDTTRADHIGCYGNDKIQTPNVDALARRGVLFQHAIAAAPITAPSHSTILTGKYPLAHGVRDNGLFVLGENQTTLAEMLRDHGYATAAAVGSFPLASKFGLDQGFDLYDDRFTAPYEDFHGRRVIQRPGLFFDERKAALVNESIYGWVEEHHQQPFFLWLHYFDPHHPLEPPAPYDELYAADPYLGEIAYADESLGVLLGRLERLGVRDRTLVVFTADHGEGRGDHNEETHAILAYDSTLRVPLILDIPGAARGSTVDRRVGTVDIVPTILDLLDLPAPGDLQGRSLLPLFEAGGETVPGPPPALYAETLASRLAHGLGELRVLYWRQYKYIFGPRPELYDLDADPRERDDLVDREADVAARMKDALAAFIERNATPDAASAVEMDAETRRRLESLGYLHTNAGEATVEERLRGDGIPPQDRVGDINEISTAKTMLHLNRPLAAKDAVLELLEHAPDNPYYLDLLARAELALGQFGEATRLIERIGELDEDGGHEGLQLFMVSQLARRGQPQRALELLEPAQEIRASARGQWYLGSLYELLGREREQAAALERALALDPQLAAARVDWAVLLVERGEVEKAAEEFRRALVDGPYDARAHYNYGTMLFAAGDPEEAARRFARAIDLDPAYLRAYVAMIAADLELGRRRDAETRLRNLAARAPRSPEVAQARQLMNGAR